MGVGLLEGPSVGQTRDLVVALGAASPFLSSTCPFAVQATRKTPHLTCSFSSGPTHETHLEFKPFWIMKSKEPSSSLQSPC